MVILKRLADSGSESSFASKFRRRRFAFFNSLLDTLPRPLSILDVGGEERFWQRMSFGPEPGVELVLFNTPSSGVQSSTYLVELGDARDMSRFRDQQFDIVFSNSVIEHAGDFGDQRLMAKEIARVGKRYFVQTPNKFFPIEPHFIFPCIQFLPESLAAILVYHLKLGLGPPPASMPEALTAVKAIRLLDLGELRQVFPGASVYRETFLGMTKSYVAYLGWE